MDTGEEQALKFAVLDVEDLAVVSAHLQDAETQRSDMAFLPRQNRFALVVARFDWPLAARGVFQRRQAGLHFERVLKVSHSGLPEGEGSRAMRLLAIAFLPGDPPSGTVLLTFLGGAQIKLAVECLEAEMRDLGPSWPVDSKPVV